MNGVYKAVYSIPGDRNEGIVFIDNGKFYGSDRTHAYYGNFVITGKMFSAQLTRMQYATEGRNMGGGGNFMTIEGTIDGERIKGKASIPGVSIKIDILLERIRKF